MSDHIITYYNGHWELYICGRFYCTGDTYEECEKEWEKFLGTLYAFDASLKEMK